MIPILIYHSINEPRYEHVWGVLSLPVHVFETQMAHLRASGMTPITLAAAYRGMTDPGSLPRRPVVVTLDDGYLDNWLFAMPILERYEIPATIFPPTSFVDPTPGLRSRDGVGPGDSASYGFCSFDELRAMEATGLISVESHSDSHAEITSGAEILDFHHPEGDAYWVYWELYPERKPFWLNDEYRRQIPLGTPIYAHTYAMVGRRWTPPEAQVESCRALVRAEGGERFFRKRDWRTALRAVIEESTPDDIDDPARFESEEEYRARVLHDLRSSRDRLELELGHPVRFLCWPCGLYDEATRELAAEVGYQSTLTCEPISNRPGEGGSLLHRLYFGQDERYLRIRADALLNLRFCGELDRAHGRWSGKLKTVVANRSMDLWDFLGERTGLNRNPRVVSASGSPSSLSSRASPNSV